ncbi:uncharacterized protein PV07_10062 [Cladophialophora immunda]|uniref:Peptidase S28 n=1 Tax=Cladophialophora immunda TaxID=569365 RepID=A0A0D2BYX8_9EURO|nr:uncharacterized protein PV07_10062 [Cladophialophora immunda]KIW24343.1 hypothetical protein PV07_10062 [Cladophialophora immunda]OQU97905.1 hypothetical protein CLAIMM_03769 [Cladophialophora immunda]
MFISLAFLALAMARTAFGLTGVNCTHPTAFYDQTIDHNATKSGTFKQQYQLIMDHYKPGGPILFFQGAETANISCLELTVLEDWAPTLGAAVVQLEHRFFGVSNPSNAANVKERYATLTLENVLQDSVSFVEYLKKNNTKLRNAKVIAHGGSYGGSLSAMLRLNHPQTFYGSIAWAGPTEGLGPDSANPARGNWYTVLSNIYSTYSAEAAAKIKAALATFHGYIKTGTNYEDLAHGLNLCEVPQNKSDLDFIYQTQILNAYTANSQFSFGVLPGLPGLTANTFDQALNLTLAATGALEVLNASLSVLFNGSCVDWAGQNAFGLAGAEQLPFQYLECRYFPIAADLVAAGTIFPAGALGYSSDRAAFCAQTFNMTIPTHGQLAAKYHFTTADLLAATHLLFTFGTLDPVSGWAPWELYARMTPNRNASSLMVVPEGGHTEDSFNPSFLTKPGVLQAQKFQLEYIKEWLGITAY